MRSSTRGSTSVSTTALRTAARGFKVTGSRIGSLKTISVQLANGASGRERAANHVTGKLLSLNATRTGDQVQKWRRPYSGASPITGAQSVRLVGLACLRNCLPPMEFKGL